MEALIFRLRWRRRRWRCALFHNIGRRDWGFVFRFALVRFVGSRGLRGRGLRHSSGGRNRRAWGVFALLVLALVTSVGGMVSGATNVDGVTAGETFSFRLFLFFSGVIAGLNAGRTEAGARSEPARDFPGVYLCPCPARPPGSQKLRGSGAPLDWRSPQAP